MGTVGMELALRRGYYCIGGGGLQGFFYFFVFLCVFFVDILTWWQYNTGVPARERH